MKLKITEIEATSEDLRQSKTLSDALTNLLRTSLNPTYIIDENDDANDEEAE